MSIQFYNFDVQAMCRHIKVAELNSPSDGNSAYQYTFLKFANLKMVCKYLRNN